MAEEIRAQLAKVIQERSALRPELQRLSAIENPSRSQEAQLEDVLQTLDNLNASERSLRARVGLDADGGSVRGASVGELRDRALRIVEADGRSLAPRQLDHIDKLLRTRSDNVDGAVIARRLVTTENEAYRSAWMKAVTQVAPAFTQEESRAMEEFRAANEGTGSAGGFGVPVLIDPTIILTSGAADAPILNVCRMVTITTDAWKGVASAGVSWSYDAEATVVSDDTPTLAQPVIPVYMARGFIPYSIEVGMDYPGFAQEMSNLLGQGFIDLVANQSAQGSGSASPIGVFTAMSNITTNPAHVLVKTSGVLGGVDVRAAWAALPERYRSRATWLMSESVENQVRALGNNLALSDFTVDLTKDGVSVLTGRPIITTDYAPSFTGTTGAENFAVVGDFSRYVFVQRAGMNVELVPHMFDSTSGRPTGQRGWFAFARHGADVVDHNGFRILANS